MTKPLFQDLSFIKGGAVSLYREELPRFVVPCHFHPSIEIMYITSGSGIRFVGDNIENYEPGDVCMIGPNLIHEWRSNEYTDSENVASCYCLFFKKEIFSGSMIQLPEMEAVKKILELSELGLKFHGTTREQLSLLIKQGENLHGLSKLTNLLEILNIMSNTNEYNIISSAVFLNSNNKNDNLRFNKVHQFIIQNFNRPITLHEIANIANMSIPAFCRYFKKRSSKTFTQYLNDIRIGQAKKLIIEGKFKISSISNIVGFNNMSNFIDQFKKNCKMLPSEYQKMYRGEN
ncbi:MAG: AraC family transcriptional regulator [Paludibacter sp.]